MSPTNLSISEAILQVLPPAPATMATFDVIDKVSRLLWDVAGSRVADESIRTTLSTMANAPGSPVVGSRSGYSLTRTTETRSDLKRVTEELRRIFNAVMARGINITPDGYPRAPGLALIDAVFSANSRYEAVINVIRRVKTRYDVNDGEEFTVSDLFKRLEDELKGVEGEEEIDERLTEVFRNRTYSAPGLHKAIQVVIIGHALLNLPESSANLPFALDTHADWERINLMPVDERTGYLDRLERELTSHRGMGPATYRYLLLLNGVQAVKPDRMILRWLSRVLGRPEALIRPRDAAELVESATARLQHEGYPFSVTAADHVLWQLESGRITLDLTDRRPEGISLPDNTPVTPGATPLGSPKEIPDRSRVHLTSESHAAGHPCGLVLSHDTTDASRVVVAWTLPGQASTSIEEARVTVERVGDLHVCDGAVDRTAEALPPTSSPSRSTEYDMMWRILEGARRQSEAGSGQTNHDKLAEALADHKGQTLSLSEMWEIVRARWGSQFDKGSFLPNDHASGNAGACWCAENRQNQPLFRRVERGRYLII